MNSLTRTDVIEQAEQWYNCVTVKKASGRQIRQFKEWYESDQLHQVAYAEVYISRESGYDFDTVVANSLHMKNVNMASSRDDKPVRNKRFSLADLAIPRRGDRSLWVACGLAAVLLGIFLLFQPVLRQPEIKIYRTRISEIRTIHLEDGSTVTLGADSSIGVPSFDSGERKVILENGEALFSVVGDSGRPFIVSADKTQVQVLGTQFNINRSYDVLTVSLLDGRVRLIQSPAEGGTSSSKTTNSVEVLPAHSISVRNGVLQPLRKQNPEEMASWIEGQLRYNSTPLGRVVSDLNRYSEKPVQIADRALYAMPVTAVLGTNQVSIFIEGLPHLLPVRISRDAAGSYIILPEV